MNDDEALAAELAQAAVMLHAVTAQLAAEGASLTGAERLSLSCRVTHLGDQLAAFIRETGGDHV